ncbi:serine hydrolase [Limibacter armeniacum]|uniref:serine hydrolase n=1 Tax=Limibacter armeniacum TaxID=466084 RepID=UPI002FE545D0
MKNLSDRKQPKNFYNHFTFYHFPLRVYLLSASIFLFTNCNDDGDFSHLNNGDELITDLEWASLRDLSSDAFGERFEQYKERGWIIKDIDAYQGRANMLYSMVWEENHDNRKWQEWRDLTNDGYHAKWEELKGKGYRPSDIEAYLTDNSMRYAGIWEENVEGLKWSSHRDLTAEEYGELFDERSGAGYRLVDMEAYQTPSGIRYAAIWYENTDNRGWAQYRDMSREVYQERIDAFLNDGYSVIDFESYMLNGQQRYAAIWEKNRYNRATAVRSDRTETEYANYWRYYRDLGMRLIDFERYETPNGTRYAGVWTENNARYSWAEKGNIDNIIEDYREANDIPGISVAIIHQGDLVYQRGFGMADIGASKQAHGRTVYLAASVSKVIGGTLAAKMESEGRLADGTTVNLDLTKKTTDYLDIPVEGHTHSVEDLLAHLGCIWEYDNGPEPPIDHYNTSQLALEEIWNTPPMSNCSIGSSINYSTHGFTFVGAVLEKVSGRPVAQLVEEEIADRYGFNSMRVQYRTQNMRSNYERAKPYSDDNSQTEATYEDNSWKVLGGGIEVDAVDLAWFGWKTLNGEIVDADTRDNRMWTRMLPASPYGLAWAIGTDTFGHSHQLVGHEGSWAGARSSLMIYRGSDQLVIAILSNRRGHNPGQDLAQVIAEEILH